MDNTSGAYCTIPVKSNTSYTSIKCNNGKTCIDVVIFGLKKDYMIDKSTPIICKTSDKTHHQLFGLSTDRLTSEMIRDLSILNPKIIQMNFKKVPSFPSANEIAFKENEKEIYDISDMKINGFVNEIVPPIPAGNFFEASRMTCDELLNFDDDDDDDDDDNDNGDDDDYDDYDDYGDYDDNHNYLSSNVNMPWVVRLFLQTEEQREIQNGFDCAGSIVDNYWIVTSRSCCNDITSIELLFNFERGPAFMYFDDEDDQSDAFEIFTSSDFELCLGMFSSVLIFLKNLIVYYFRLYLKKSFN